MPTAQNLQVFLILKYSCMPKLEGKLKVTRLLVPIYVTSTNFGQLQVPTPEHIGSDMHDR